LERPAQQSPRFCFGAFEFDPRTGELSHDHELTVLQQQPAAILLALLERPGDLITREELVQRLWPTGTFVDFDRSLNKAVNKLREALQDSAQNSQFIQTLPRRGYRFIAPVETQTSVAPGSIEVRPGTSSSGASPAGTQIVSHPNRKQVSILVSALVVTVGVLVTLGLSYLASQRYWPKYVSTGKVMLAVLPFENLSGGSEQDYFSDGLTEEIITQLGSLQPSRLGVIARNSSMKYKHTNKIPSQIGHELGVDYILGGTVRRDAGRTRITVQLIQVSDQTYMWTRTYERDLRDILGLQSEVAQAIGNEVKVRLTPQEKLLLSGVRPFDPEAHEAYLRGLYFWNKRTEEGLEKAVAYFQAAVERDPSYAAAYAGLADSYLLLGDFGFLAPEEAYPKAKSEAQKAVATSDHLAEAHAALAMVALEYDWDWADAEKKFRRAIEINQNYATAHQWYAEHLITLGRYEEAIGQVNQARELDPLSLPINATAGLWLYYAQRYGPAIEQSKKTIEMDPNFWMPHWVLGRIYNRQELYGKAIPELRIATALPGPRTFVLSELGYAYARSARKTEARMILGTLKDQGKARHDTGLDAARIYIGMGEPDQALACLEAGYNQHSMYLIWLNVEPTLMPLHSDPRFQDLVRRVGIP